MTEKETPYQHFFATNPYVEDATKALASYHYNGKDDALISSLLAIAFELNKIRTENINVEARVFDGDR